MDFSPKSPTKNRKKKYCVPQWMLDKNGPVRFHKFPTKGERKVIVQNILDDNMKLQEEKFMKSQLIIPEPLDTLNTSILEEGYAEQVIVDHDESTSPECSTLLVESPMELCAVGIEEVIVNGEPYNDDDDDDNYDPLQNQGLLTPVPTTQGGSADDYDSDSTSRLVRRKYKRRALTADDCDSDYNNSRPIISRRYKRGVLPKQATSVLKSWLLEHVLNPYPTEEEKLQLSTETNLTLVQVNNWFINARRRILPPMLDLVAGGGTPSLKKRAKRGRKRSWPPELCTIQSPNTDTAQIEEHIIKEEPCDISEEIEIKCEPVN